MYMYMYMPTQDLRLQNANLRLFGWKWHHSRCRYIHMYMHTHKKYSLHKINDHSITRANKVHVHVHVHYTGGYMYSVQVLCDPTKPCQVKTQCLIRETPCTCTVWHLRNFCYSLIRYNSSPPTPSVEPNSFLVKIQLTNIGMPALSKRKYSHVKN